MTPGQAAWVREHAWTGQMRALESSIWPGYFTRCECQRDACHDCSRGKHERCSGTRERTSREGMIMDRSGVDFVRFAKPYAHRTIDGPPRPTPVAQVWLADRVCRWSCQCGCRDARRTMTEKEAAWIRANAWTPGMLQDYHPRSQHSCDCEYGTSTHCERGQHRRCHVGAPLPSCEGHLLDKAGAVLYFTQPYRHPSVSATGWHPTRAVMVWRAGQPCAWHCPCTCGHPGATPAHAVRPAAPEPAAAAIPRTYELVELPGLDLAGVR